MDWKAFTIHLIGELAWPVVVLVVVIVLRQPLAGLISRLKSLSILGNQAEFAEQVHAAAALINARPAEPAREETVAPDMGPEGTQSHQERLELLLGLVDHEPEAAVLAAWRLIELELTRVGSLVGSPDTHSPISIADRLARGNEIPVSIADGLRLLRDLRNKVAHGPTKVLPDTAREYVKTAMTVVASLEAVARDNR